MSPDGPHGSKVDIPSAATDRTSLTEGRCSAWAISERIRREVHAPQRQPSTVAPGRHRHNIPEGVGLDYSRPSRIWRPAGLSAARQIRVTDDAIALGSIELTEFNSGSRTAGLAYPHSTGGSGDAAVVEFRVTVSSGTGSGDQRDRLMGGQRTRIGCLPPVGHSSCQLPVPHH